ncbi:MAG: hypothetical protein IPH54_15420 [Rhodoferax sp.]|nr:hypothetical protein [Rhodoferax sp.]
MQGFMQTLGALLADECVYSFERSAELIRIPRLPVEMRPESYVIDNLTAFRRMSLGLNVMQSQALSVPELLLLTVDDQVAPCRSGANWFGVACANPFMGQCCAPVPAQNCNLAVALPNLPKGWTNAVSDKSTSRSTIWRASSRLVKR